MRKRVVIKGEEVEYALKKSKRARHVRLYVNYDASVSVTMPYRLPEGIVEKFLKEKGDWVLEKISFYKNQKIPILRDGQYDFEKYKREARKLILERLEFFNTFYDFRFNKVFIKNQRSKWGSCSINKNLNFNFKLALIPKECADYIIVHELCHLGEFNHSKRFWKLVEKAIPDYKKRIKEIRGL